MNMIRIEIDEQLISIPGCDSKSWTVSTLLTLAAQFKAAVQLNIDIQFQKWYKIKISWNK